MSRKTTGVPGTTRRRVLVGTAMLSVTALIGSGVAGAVGGGTPTVTGFKVFGAADGVEPVGPLRGLNSVLEVTGTNLDEVTSITFGSTPAAHWIAESPTLLYVTPPAASAAGEVNVLFDTASAAPADLADYTYTAGPVLTSASVADKQLVVEGSQLTGATAVLVGDTLVKVDTKKAPATDTKVSVKVPSVKGGSLDVSVITPNGIGTLAGAYGVAPVISKILPNLTKGAKAVTRASAATGTVSTGTSDTSTVATYAGDTGTVVLVTGTGFSGLKSITFGKAAASAVVISDTLLRVRVPAKHADDAFDAAKSPNVLKVDVVAENGFGKSKAAKFEYAKAPVLTGASDVVGRADASTNTVTLTGSGLKGAKVTFGTKAGKVTASDDGTLTVTAPKQAAADVAVKVVTPAGFYVLPVTYGYKATDATTAWPTS